MHREKAEIDPGPLQNLLGILLYSQAKINHMFFFFYEMKPESETQSALKKNISILTQHNSKLS